MGPIRVTWSFSTNNCTVTLLGKLKITPSKPKTLDGTFIYFLASSISPHQIQRCDWLPEKETFAILPVGINRYVRSPKKILVFLHM